MGRPFLHPRLTLYHVYIVILITFLASLTAGAGGRSETCASRADGTIELPPAATADLARFLEDRAAASDAAPGAAGRFYVQGWRWHTMSLAREARRLQQLVEAALQTTAADGGDDRFRAVSAALQQAVDYVVEFNMAGLHRIERELFFPWVSGRVAPSILDTDAAHSFRDILDRLEQERSKLGDLGKALVKATTQVAEAGPTKSPPSELKQQTLLEIASASAAISERAWSMLDIEDKYLVPTIAALVPAKEQKSFNDKVIRKLGLLDSRLYLVGMHEALEDLQDPVEQQLFEESIPLLARKMIPWWKRQLYDPRVGSILEMQPAPI